jgi:hypothetical protein
MIFHLIITLDYELPAMIDGDVRRHMIEPTANVLDACQQHDAKLTVLAEVGELWAFEKVVNAGFREHLRYDPAGEIRRQLVDVIQRGHDVQLHLHPQWVNARWQSGQWHLDYAHHSLTDFADGEMVDILRRGKADLEAMLRPHDRGYECVGFRAGNWNTRPANRYIAALRAAGLKSDTSVFKWGYANSAAVGYDYRSAYSNVCAWYAQDRDLNSRSSEGIVLEVPIATELVRSIKMLTPKRLSLARKYLREDGTIEAAVKSAKGSQARSGGAASRLRKLLGRCPMKLDFCKLTAPEMLGMVRSFIRQCRSRADTLPIPLVMIGHSKAVGAAPTLGRFLGMLKKECGGMVRLSTYRGFISEYETAAGAAKSRRESMVGPEQNSA